MRIDAIIKICGEKMGNHNAERVEVKGMKCLEMREQCVVMWISRMLKDAKIGIYVDKSVNKSIKDNSEMS